MGALGLFFVFFLLEAVGFALGGFTGAGLATGIFITVLMFITYVHIRTIAEAAKLYTSEVKKKQTAAVYEDKGN